MKRFFIAIILIIGGMRLAFAAYPDGACGPPTGNGPINYNYTFDSTVTNPADNTAGRVIPPQTKNGPGTFSLTCNCTGDYSSHQWTTTSLPVSSTDGNLTFFKASDYLSAAIEIKDSYTQEWYPLPWVDHFYPNGYRAACNTTLDNFDTGNTVRITVKIDKPFIGHVVIPNVKLADLWYTVGPTFIKGAPSVSIYLGGSVTVPQNCVIDSGKIISVDFGNMYSGDFKAAGLKAKSAKTKSFNVPIECTNIGTSANLTLRIEATPDANYPQAIKTNKENVGVVVTNNQGGILKPDDINSTLPFVTDSVGKANLTLQAYPVSTTGIAPDEGVFTALAYIRIDFA